MTCWPVPLSSPAALPHTLVRLLVVESWEGDDTIHTYGPTNLTFETFPALLGFVEGYLRVLFRGNPPAQFSAERIAARQRSLQASHYRGPWITGHRLQTSTKYGELPHIFANGSHPARWRCLFSTSRTAILEPAALYPDSAADLARELQPD